VTPIHIVRDDGSGARSLPGPDYRRADGFRLGHDRGPDRTGGAFAGAPDPAPAARRHAVEERGPELGLAALDRATAQRLWSEIMWCCTREQLLDVAARIRSEYSATPAQRQANAGELARLRMIYRIRLDTMVDPRGDGPTSPRRPSR
jgi:hypothetical protein